IMEKTYVEQQSMVDANQPKGNHYYWKSEYLSALPDAVLSVIREHGARETSPLCQMVLFHIGGAIGEKGPQDGAVGNRDAAFGIETRTAPSARWQWHRARRIRLAGASWSLAFNGSTGNPLGLERAEAQGCRLDLCEHRGSSF